MHRAADHDEGVRFAGVFERVLQALGVLFAVFEFQCVDGQHLLADFEAALRIEKCIEARARAYAVVVTALRADVDVLLEVGFVKHRFALWDI